MISIDAPARLALIFICETCGNRLKDSGKNQSRRLASTLRKAAKRRCQKGDIRSVLTSCLDLCPDDRIAVHIAPASGRHRSAFYTVGVEDREETAVAIIDAVLDFRRV